MKQIANNTQALALAALLAIGAASCSSGSEDSTSAPEDQTESGQTGSADSSSSGGRIQINNFIFSAVVPGPFTFKPGETITVENLDGTEHTLTSADGLFDTGTITAEDGTATFVAPSEPGTYEFFCSIHPEMVGTMIIAG